MSAPKARECTSTRTVPAAASAANAEIAAMTEGDPLTVVDPDMRFHAALVDALGSPRTSRMFGSLVSEVRLCMVQVQGKQLLTTASIAAEHQQILDAVLAGDGEAAVEAITRHLGRARERLVAALGGSPGPEATLPEPA